MLKRSAIAVSLIFSPAAAMAQETVGITQGNVAQHALLAEGLCVSMAQSATPISAAARDFCTAFLNESDKRSIEEKACSDDNLFQKAAAEHRPDVTYEALKKIDDDLQACLETARHAYQGTIASLMGKHYPDGIAVSFQPAPQQEAKGPVLP